jgi:DNA-binding GntR family transcriptional regulator
MKTINDSTIEMYESFLEEAHRKLYRSHTYEEEKYKSQIKQYEAIIAALKQLQ